jgi:hypothetical protein
VRLCEVCRRLKLFSGKVGEDFVALFGGDGHCSVVGRENVRRRSDEGEGLVYI